MGGRNIFDLHPTGGRLMAIYVMLCKIIMVLVFVALIFENLTDRLQARLADNALLKARAVLGKQDFQEAHRLRLRQLHLHYHPAVRPTERRHIPAVRAQSRARVRPGTGAACGRIRESRLRLRIADRPGRRGSGMSRN